MLELWPASAFQLHPFTDEKEWGSASWATNTFHRHSVTRSADPGNWNSGHTQEWAQSLPPAAAAFYLHGEIQQGAASGDRGLSSTPPASAERGPGPGAGTVYTPKRDVTSGPSKQLCLQSEQLLVKTAQPRTPAPSLISSQYSLSSSAFEGSSTTDPASVHCPDMLSERFAHTMMRSFEPLNLQDRPSVSQKTIYSDDIFDQAMAICQDNEPAIPLPSRLTRGENTNVNVYRPPSCDVQPEVSYIDWDDDENGGQQGLSIFARLKRSLAELRATERLISDAHARRRAFSVQQGLKSTGVCKGAKALAANTSEPKDSIQDDRFQYRTLSRPAASKAQHAIPPTAQWKQGTDGMRTPAKLRKRRSTRSISRNYAQPRAGRQSSSCCRHDRRTIRSDLGGLLPLMPTNVHQEPTTTSVATSTLPAVAVSAGKVTRTDARTPQSRRAGKRGSRLEIFGKCIKRILGCKTRNKAESCR